MRGERLRSCCTVGIPDGVEGTLKRGRRTTARIETSSRSRFGCARQTLVTLPGLRLPQLDIALGERRAGRWGRAFHDLERQAATHEEIIRCEKRRSARNKSSATYLSHDSGAARARHGNPSIANVGLELAACLMLDREARLNHQVLDQSVRAPGLPHRREAQDVAVEGRRQCSTFRCFRRQAKKSLTPL